MSDTRQYIHFIELLVYKLENIKDIVRGVSEAELIEYLQELIDLLNK